MTQNSSNSSGGGNTISPPTHKKKQISPAKKWCFTMNNYTEEAYSSIIRVLDDSCDVAIIGKEIGESGTPHLQGYCEFKVKCRPKSVISQVAVSELTGTQIIEWAYSIHWEKAKGSKQQNVRYCSKDDKKAWTKGCKVKKELKLIKESQLYQWQKNIIKEIDGEPDDRKVMWYWSHEGCIGKTAFGKWLFARKGAYVLNGKGTDVRNGIIQYYQHEGDTPEFIIYPIPRCHGSDYVSYEALENIKDMFFYSGKYEGGMVCGNAPHLLILANAPPKESKLSMDRWDIVCIDPENAPIDNSSDELDY